LTRPYRGMNICLSQKAFRWLWGQSSLNKEGTLSCSLEGKVAGVRVCPLKSI